MPRNASGVRIGGAVPLEIVFPECTSAPPGSRKPRARIVLGEMAFDSEAISLPVAAARLLGSRLSGGEVSVGSRSELLYEVGRAEESTALERVVSLCSHRDHSRHELDEKLRLDGYPEGCRTAVLDRAAEVSIIDDSRFAEAFVRSKTGAGWGERRISRELGRRGIDPSGVDSLRLLSSSPEAEYERALGIVSRRRIPEKNAYAKLVRFLVARGFSPSASSRAVREVLSADEGE